MSISYIPSNLQSLMKRLIVPALAAVLLVVACVSKNKVALGPDPLAAHIDSTVNPAADFFLYANGKWFKQNPIPGSEQSNGLWTIIQDTINEQIKSICISSSKANESKGSNKQKIGDFYASGLDSTLLNKKGLADIQANFGKIDNIKNLQELLISTADIMKISSSPLFNFYVSQDDKYSSKNAIFISQGGISMPDKIYYTKTDAKSVEIKSQYKMHLSNTFKLIGMNESTASAASNDVFSIENNLAEASKNREDTRDPLANYNKMNVTELIKLTPNIQWPAFFTAVGIKTVDSVIVGQPQFLLNLNSALQKFKLDQWKNYLKYHLIKGLSRYLDDKTYQENFNFYSKTLRGIKTPKQRWKRVVEQTNSSLGELIGQVYVKEYLPEGTKEKLMEIGNAIKVVYEERIKKLDWMSEPTKKMALKKLDAVIMKMGYPDKWKDLSSIEIDKSSYAKNIMNCNKWSFDFMVAKYGKPVDRAEWNMQPQTYNAYYNPSNNEIVIPGCNIIVPGFERTLADDAILYSIIGGSTIGHEITHGFDDQGSQYNELGNLSDWWTPEDRKKFNERTNKIVKQFDNFIAIDDLHVNGSLTQGENIADLGGIIMGYEAFKNTDQYKKKEKIAGLTPDQRFFLGYAFAWMINYTPESLATQVKSNEHSPAKFRVIGPLANMPEFHQTFGVKNGDAMWTDEATRVKIW